MFIDITQLDLKAIIERYAHISFTRVANTGGGEFSSTCPWCFGQDRFRCWPYAERPHFWCRNCRKNGDAIAFVMEHEGVSFRRALKDLEIETSDGSLDMDEMQFRFYDDPPCKEWQNAASDFIQRAERYLWLENVEMSRKALEYLRGRGFTDETIRGAKLGYVPLARDGRWFSAPLEAWGLSQEQTLKDVVRIADGIVIPWIAFGDVWKICIKRPWVENSKTELVYGQVVGSGEGLYGADSIKPGEPALLVEGEFDKLTVSQESDIACAATGSTSRGRIQRWIQLFNQASLVLQSFDNDAAGDDGAVFWLENIPKAIRWKPWKKDPNEMLQRGQPVGVWVELGIQSAQIVQPTPCPSESEIQASSQQVIDTCCLCDAPVDEVDELGKPYCLLHWNCLTWGKKPCPTIQESKNKTHAPYPVVTMDNAGYLWCERCLHQPKLMNAGVERGFLAFYFEWQHDMVYVEQGRDAWFQFACTAGYARVFGALEAIKKQQPQEQTTAQEVEYNFS